jgi:hypothetical protein
MAVAYCWATGEIQIGDNMPDGALPLAFGDAHALQSAVDGLATLSYNNVTRLIPGIHTSGSKDKIDIVLDFAKLLRAEVAA